MSKGLFVAIAFLPMVAVSSFAGDVESQQETYTRVSNALRAGDFKVLRQFLSLQPGLTFDALEKNWHRAQKTFQAIFPSSDEFALVERFEATGGDHFWIVEMKEVQANNKFLKVYRFTANSENGSGWKVSAAKQSGSYNHPDGAGIRHKIIGDIRRSIESES